MKNSNRSQEHNVNDIIEYSKMIIEFTKGMNYEQFEKDKKTQLATIRCIEVIGEAASELNDLTKIKYPGIEWKEAIGMRGKMIHHYEGIQLDIIWDTIQKNIPELLNKMQNEVEIKSEKHKDKSPGMGM